MTSANTSLLLSPREWRALAVELTSDPSGAATDRAAFVLGVLLAAVVTVALLRWRVSDAAVGLPCIHLVMVYVLWWCTAVLRL